MTHKYKAMSVQGEPTVIQGAYELPNQQFNKSEKEEEKKKSW